MAQDTDTPTPRHLQVWEFLVSPTESTWQILAGWPWVIPQALLNLLKTKKIYFLLSRLGLSMHGTFSFLFNDIST